MKIEYNIHKDGVISYVFDTNSKEETYLQSISDKNLSFVQRNKGEKEFIVVDIPHYKGINMLHQCSWGFEKSKYEGKIVFYIIPRHVLRNLEYDRYELITGENYEPMIDMFSELGWLYYKTPSILYFTKLNKKYLHIKDKKFYDVKHRILNTRG